MIYLSGKITGLDRDDYLSIFERHEIRTWKDYDTNVINPAAVMDELPGMEHDQYMTIAMTLLKMCDTIYLIPGWEDSKGAKLELMYAIEHDYKIMVGGE